MRFSRVLCLTVLSLFALLQPARADEGQRVILVLDASGSMRAKIDGKSKMDIAKEVVGKIVANWKPEDELGLIAYGHRQKGSCDDIEVLSEPGTLDGKAFMAKVKSLSPKGKTPMTAAVKMAAESLQYTEKKATVILVSDGIETCGLNPCSVAEELKSTGVNLTVHTVGFGLDDPAAAGQLKCLADKTGGISIVASNADELEKALTKTVEVTETQPAQPPAEPGITMNGHVWLADKAELMNPFTQPGWTIRKATTDGSDGEAVSTDYAVDLKKNLPPGDYVADISVSYARVKTPFTVTAGKIVDVEPVLNAGTLTAAGTMDGKVPADSNRLSWEILAPNGDNVATLYDIQPRLLLNAGDYTLVLNLGEAKASQSFTITAGKDTDLTLALNAGQAELTAQFSDKGPAASKDVTFEVHQAVADVDGQHPRITTSYELPARIFLPAGHYLFTADTGYAHAEMEGDVSAAQVSKIAFNLNAGYLNVKAGNATSFEIYSSEKDISGEAKRIGTEYGAEFNKAFNAGIYHIKAYGDGGAVIGEKDIEVKAGQRTEATIP
ncbi:vWA domain-containing protein [Aestuariivirga sp.]|uniref:vWA domain-containing protein n=1 Tax=Aestuariivirga sp. TaxID=2650926 RepID=UPI0039E5EC2D